MVPISSSMTTLSCKCGRIAPLWSRPGVAWISSTANWFSLFGSEVSNLHVDLLLNEPEFAKAGASGQPLSVYSGRDRWGLANA